MKRKLRNVSKSNIKKVRRKIDGRSREARQRKARGIVARPAALLPVQHGKDMAITPPHYTHATVQGIDFIHAHQMTYPEGSIIKYVSRYKLKNGRQDLLKAVWYLLFILTFDREFCNEVAHEIDARSRKYADLVPGPKRRK